MSFQNSINEVKTQHPSWNSTSRIVGRAGEIYCCRNIKCMCCGSLDWLECVTNEKSQDQICKNCDKKYQIKCKNITQGAYRKVKETRTFKTIGAEYTTTVNSIDNHIDYIIVLYEKETNDILDIIHIKSADITCDNIIARKPLGPNARRAGWQGCNLHFTNIDFVNELTK